jgi:glycosyltransferase involved in cell wall biosynthesis
VIRVLFLIRALQAGGAERQLVTLARHLDPARFAITVVTFYPGGELEADLSGIPALRLLSAAKRGRWDLLGFLFRLWRLVRRVRPDIMHGYMYGANELSWLLGRAIGAHVVWGIRASNMDVKQYDWATKVLFRTGAWLAPRVDLIIANSAAGRDHHVSLGYPPGQFIVIPNGIDTTAYRRDPAARARVRLEWGIRDDELLIGIVARLDPMKDHETFLRAASRVSLVAPHIRFAIVGSGPTPLRVALECMARELSIAPRIVWTGRRHDIAAIHCALDLATSTSAFGEGVSNSLGEAMACETPCVATNVGDARALLGDTGIVVPVRDAAALAAAWLDILRDGLAERTKRGHRARARIVEQFSVVALAARTSEFLESVMAAGPVRSTPVH